MSVILALALLFFQAPAKQHLEGATHVTRVDATLMCGGATSPSAFPELKKLGFTSIINLRRDNEADVDVTAAGAAADAAGLKYVHIPVDPAKPTTESVDAFLKAVTDSANHPMYVHCGSANRVAAMWLIKRVMVDGWTTERAAEEAAAIGLTSPGLKKFALDYVAARRR
jgi:uncharacterized protein (TIGR01244 family)